MKKYLNKNQNNFLYFFSSGLLYFILYILISKNFEGVYFPVLGAIILISSIFIDYYLSKKNIRIYIRLVFVIICYILLKSLVLLFSTLASPPGGYNLFVDKLPYLFDRDTIIALIFIVFYFIFDSARIIRASIIGYSFSTAVIILVYFLALKFDIPITKTIFINYFNLAIFLILVIILLLFRHIVFNQNLTGRKLEKKDLMLFIPIFLAVIFILFIFILPEHIKEDKKNISGLYQQNLFQFDFSNYLELKDEIKQSDDRVLILELQGVKDSISKRINKGWNRQIYLKRFSLEDYLGDGRFKMAEEFVDPNSPPNYISNYKWELKTNPRYKDRADIVEILYLINIDPSSLMGSDLLTKVIPVTNWQGSPYKQIYKSFCSIQDISYMDLLDKNPAQEKYLKNLHSQRKKMLLNWGNKEKEGKIKELAESLTQGMNDPLSKAIIIQEYLKREFYYSLKPGFAKNGNQLEYFLFESKKGYCSYFAFAMTLMLRSIGIASRVVVGFAPDMENRTLNFYDVRSLHGHAWVEVFFDDYGWITFDPTSSIFPPDEKYNLFLGNKEERDDLIKEILKNKDKMKDIDKEKEGFNFFENINQTLKHSLRILGIISFILIIVSFLLLIYLRKKYNLIMYFISHDPRSKAKYLFKDTVGYLFDLGYHIKTGESILEFSDRIKEKQIADIVDLTKLYQTAMFREKKEFDISLNDILIIRKKIKQDFKRIKLRYKIKSFFNISLLWKKILPLFFLIFFLPWNNLYGQDFTNLDDYLIESRAAVNEGYYDKALELLNKAEKLFPTRYEPNFEKGKLYYYYELNENALTELLKAKKKGCQTEENYQYIASSYGKIGEYKKSVKIYEEAFEKLYHSINMYDKLSWMYYKINNLDKGINKVLEGLTVYPNSSDLLMTLGTLYSAKYDYKRSKMSYLDSIKYSYTDYNSNYFRSIVYYNLSLLEKTFLHYDEAYNSAIASISADDRGSPHLQLNYLYIGALDLKNAYNEVIKSSGMKPDTLFPQLSLVYIYLISGRIDDAINLINQLLKEKDFSWMLYFGTNKEEFFSELYRDISLAYEFKSKQINFNDKNDFFSYLLRPFKRIYYLVLFKYYNFKYANLYIKIGEEKIKGGGQLDGLSYFVEGYEKIWPAKALKALRLAENIEIKTNPGKKRIYNIREAILNKQSSIFYTKSRKRNILNKNLVLLDKKWENDIIAETLLELIKSSSGKEKEKYTEKLFLIHAPYLAMNNFKIKFDVRFSDPSFKNKHGSKLIKSLRNRGMINQVQSRFALVISNSSISDFVVDLYDGNKYLKSERISIDNKMKKRFYDNLSLEIFNKLFISNIN